MKKVALTLILILSLSPFLHAQWVNNPGGTIYTTSDNVGIGTTTPVAGLSTEAGENAAIAPLTVVPNGSAWIGGSGTTGGISMGQFSGNYGYIQSRNKGVASSGYKLALNPLGGFVGIGTATPASVLHVRDFNSTLLTVERFNSAGNMNIAYKNNTYTIYAGLNTNGGFSIGTTANFVTSSVFTATSDGNVGIGTFTPQNKLDVNGAIHSKSVLIDLNGWSDDVFKKDYQLLSLAEVKTYIDQNQHLPEVPSEQELIKNGLNVGEMNKLLMKKVEELTLYLIEKDKKEKEQETINQKLLSQVSLLMHQVTELSKKDKIK